MVVVDVQKGEMLEGCFDSGLVEMGYRRQKNISWFCVFESQSYLMGVQCT